MYYVICFNYFEDFSPHNFLICIFVEMDDLALGQFRNCSRLKARLKANIKFVPEIDCIIFIHHFQGKRHEREEDLGLSLEGLNFKGWKRESSGRLGVSGEICRKS